MVPSFRLEIELPAKAETCRVAVELGPLTRVTKNLDIILLLES